ncbi:hypothetical protein [Neobacillus sp.]|uniref:hypothetical protein n=1 Tax=Neobacillus sp. TaxID=2675273 RepID=UPI0028A00454|nr:hypothetical protein [Neobacillus sp.]
MLGVVGVLVVAIIILVKEIPYLKKKKLKREGWTFSILLLFAVGLGIAQSLHLNIPNPLNGLTFIFKPLSKILNEWLK